jgi:hypothetical protein
MSIPAGSCAKRRYVTSNYLRSEMQDILLTRIQNWYKTNCNNDWEHTFGFSIQTIDNPGWIVKIDLSDTPLENLQFEMKIDNGRFDWILIKTEDNIFEAACDPSKLNEVLRMFLDEIIPNYSDTNFHYQVYIPLIGGSTSLWRPVNAIMLTEELLEIVNIPDLKFEDIKSNSFDDINFNEEDILTFKSTYSVGDKIKTELMEMLDEVTLVAKEK